MGQQFPCSRAYTVNTKNTIAEPDVRLRVNQYAGGRRRGFMRVRAGPAVATAAFLSAAD